jgi:hypothetical protein
MPTFSLITYDSTMMSISSTSIYFSHNIHVIVNNLFHTHPHDFKHFGHSIHRGQNM